MVIRGMSHLLAVNSISFEAAWKLTILATLGTDVLLGNQLSAEKVFL